MVKLDRTRHERALHAVLLTTGTAVLALKGEQTVALSPCVDDDDALLVWYLTAAIG